MRTIWNIARNDLRQIFLERDIWINLVVVPLVLAYVIGLANMGIGGGDNTTRLPVDVIDRDGSALSMQFLDELRQSNDNLLLCPQDTGDNDACALGDASLDTDLAETRLKDQTSLALIEIPTGFGATLAAGENTEIVYRSNEDASAPSYILQSVQATAQRLSAALIAERVGSDVVETTPGLRLDDDARAQIAVSIRDRVEVLLDAQPAAVISTTSSVSSAREQSDGGATGFTQSVPGIATMYVMFAVFPAAVALMTERKQWTLQRLVTMPVTRAQILGGKLLARFIVGMIQYGIVFAFGYVLGVRYGNDPVAIVLTMIVFVFCITALTLALTTLLRNENQANAITLLLTITLAPLGGAWWPLEIVPGWMRTLGHISPVAWAMDSYSQLISYSKGLVDVLPYIAVLLLLGVVFFGFGVARFKYE